MKTIRRNAAVFACLGLLGVAGCSSRAVAGRPAGATVAVPDPAQGLARSLSGVEAGRYGWDVTFPGHHLRGVIDRPGRRAQWSATLRDEAGQHVVQTRVIGSDQYVMSTDPPNAPAGVWEHFDQSRLPASEDLLAGPDVIGVTTLARAMTATSVDGAVLRGMLNLAATGQPPADLTLLVPWWAAGRCRRRPRSTPRGASSGSPPISRPAASRLPRVNWWSN